MNNKVTSIFQKITSDISNIKLPKKFTFPFDYTPHPIALLAANQLQNYLINQTDWTHNFGLEPNSKPDSMGKMFGVLIVRSPKGELGYLQAFSGILAGKTKLPQFVPPIFDRQAPAFEYSQKEDKILIINQAIEALEINPDFINAKNNLKQFICIDGDRIQELRRNLKTAKKSRQKLRKEAKVKYTEEEYLKLVSNHEKESRKYDFEYKTELAKYNLDKEELEAIVQPYLEQLINYKKERKSQSAETQKLLFKQYEFLNFNGNTKDVGEIFSEKRNITPPSGAGDCAAPKLLQYAYKNKYTPIALAEFWWGKSPSLEVRQHQKYYPACKAKCHPILSFMLLGLNLDPNPVTEIDSSTLTIETLYEDEWVTVINKPANLLSVPGKEIIDSVQNRMIEKYKNATGPLVVHRLDMATSGIMLIAKNLATYHHLQQQFIKRSIKKRYTAILNGTVDHPFNKIDLPLRVDLNNRPSQVVCYEHGKSAITTWKKISESANQTRVYFYPVTGRTHQLRVHASHPKGLNTPILGDELYGKRATRLHLHADKIEFTHPVLDKKMTIECAAPF